MFNARARCRVEVIYLYIETSSLFCSNVTIYNYIKHVCHTESLTFYLAILSVFAGAKGPGPFSPGTHCWAGGTPNVSSTCARAIGFFFLLPSLASSEITFLFMTRAFALSKIALAFSLSLTGVIFETGGALGPPWGCGATALSGSHSCGAPRPRPLPAGVPLPAPTGGTRPAGASAPAAAGGVVAVAAAAAAAAVAWRCSCLACSSWRSRLVGRVSAPPPPPRPLGVTTGGATTGAFALAVAASSSRLEVASSLACWTAFSS